ncbi:MAG TPA: hypothetical protein VKP69_27245, partial [Isosphaeraceae bacterium]|nr:hypothetical protein [Isosphaeraceae bacterium]
MLSILLLEVLILREQFGSRRPSRMLGLDGGWDLLGMVVDGLSATVGSLGLMSDVAVCTSQARGGIGDPDDDR